jgi:beta-glucosidase/6-phospho-beta-glucosidase/beta-galactosidase
MTALPNAPLFSSFWIGGFESACHINKLGARLDMIAASQHDVQVASDYELLRSVGITTAREGIRWPQIERSPGRYDFSSLVPMVRAAREQGIQVNWNLCHYGWPDDLDVFSPAFVDRFARFSKAAAGCIAEETDALPLYTPVNEISFLAWAAGDVGGFIHPHAKHRGNELKRQLVRAAIAGIEAVWSVNARARIVHVDPVIQVFPARDRPDLAPVADAYTESQFDAWDMLCGRKAPELGGSMAYLDVMGVNYYHSNQWEIVSDDLEVAGGRLRWEDEPRDDRWIPLHQLLLRLHRRYGRPIFIGETSHFGAGRARWITEIADEAVRAFEAGLPLEGICLYPIIDRHDWEDPNHWHNSGLWDLERAPDGTLARRLNAEYAAALEAAQRRLEPIVAARKAA